MTAVNADGLTAQGFRSHLTTMYQLRRARRDDVGTFFMANVAVVEGALRQSGARAEVAEDCASEAFRRLYEQYLRHDAALQKPHVPARALWCTIARNLFIDQVRRGRNEWVVDIWPLDAPFPNLDVVVQYHLCEGKLVGDDSLLAAFHAGGYLLREIAQVIGKSISQTGKDIAQVVQRLADCMEAA